MAPARSQGGSRGDNHEHKCVFKSVMLPVHISCLGYVGRMERRVYVSPNSDFWELGCFKSTSCSANGLLWLQNYPAVGNFTDPFNAKVILLSSLHRWREQVNYCVWLHQPFADPKSPHPVCCHSSPSVLPGGHTVRNGDIRPLCDFEVGAILILLDRNSKISLLRSGKKWSAVTFVCVFGQCSVAQGRIPVQGQELDRL